MKSRPIGQIFSYCVSVYLGVCLLRNNQQTSLFNMVTALLEASNRTRMSHMFLAHTYTHSSLFPCRGSVWQELVE